MMKKRIFSMLLAFILVTTTVGPVHTVDLAHRNIGVEIIPDTPTTPGTKFTQISPGTLRYKNGHLAGKNVTFTSSYITENGGVHNIYE